jgi:hypothetical protein
LFTRFDIISIQKKTLMSSNISVFLIQLQTDDVSYDFQ